MNLNPNAKWYFENYIRITNKLICYGFMRLMRESGEVNSIENPEEK